jgi:2-C-methyl-D-erythritol 2,4-cyclodiphosphate synthase/2-C-methyl-D-erythritol 4-phosphate cytidylyltransferase
MKTKCYVIIPAGGTGTRVGLPYPKQLLPFRETTVIGHAVRLFEGFPIWVPVPAVHRDAFTAELGEKAVLVEGGETRFQSVRNAFAALPDPADDDLVIIHDAARPFYNPSDLEQALSMAKERGAVIYAAPAVDTIKRAGMDGAVAETLDRNAIYHAQTPQIFSAGLLRRAYAHHDSRGGAPLPTDEASLLEGAGYTVYVFPSQHGNRKITNPEDLTMLQGTRTRIGHGHDVHRFDAERPLYLGGVHIEEGPGLLGHSDADVVIHALIDAMLGAAGLGDIGQWFPDSDPNLSGIRSTLLLEKVWSDLRGRGYQLVNADVTIQAQIPKLAPHIPRMRACLAEILGTSPENVNVKATTTERMGYVGRAEGMAADAVVLLSLKA